MLTKQQEIIKLEIPQKIPIPRIIKKYNQTHSRQGQAQECVRGCSVVYTPALSGSKKKIY